MTQKLLESPAKQALCWPDCLMRLLQPTKKFIQHLQVNIAVLPVNDQDINTALDEVETLKKLSHYANQRSSGVFHIEWHS